MSNDYTLPEMPTTDGDARTAFGVRPVYLRQTMLTYGHACAEHARAPLAEENARLKDRLRSVCQTLVNAVGADGPCDAEDAAARAVARIAELEAKNTGLLDQHARDSKELRALCEQRDEYLVASRRLQADKRALLQGSQEQASEISRLRAEVEALRADAELFVSALAALLAHSCVADAGADCKTSEDHAAEREAKRLIDAAIAARKGEGQT